MSNTEVNHYISAFSYINWNDVGWDLSEFSYGFLSQGVNTVTGTYSLLKDFYFNKETYKELSELTWGEIKNADYYEFGKSIVVPVAEGFVNMGKDYLTGNPESSGRAAFDIFNTLAGEAKNKSQKTYYYYTNAADYEKIMTNGIKINKEGLIYTTPKGNRTPTQAQIELAMGHKPPPTHIVEIRPKIEPVLERRVTGNLKGYDQAGKLVGYGPGGGIEVLFNQNIPVSDIVKPKSAVILKIESAVTQTVKYAPYVLEPQVLLNESKTNGQQTNEGGHKLNSQIKTIVLLDKTIKRGFYKQVLKSDVMYVILNEVDLPRINSEFFINLTNGNSNTKFENKEVKPKTRNEVFPNEKRKQRGL